jgi:hypothetical protein
LAVSAKAIADSVATHVPTLHQQSLAALALNTTFVLGLQQFPPEKLLSQKKVAWA